VSLIPPNGMKTSPAITSRQPGAESTTRPSSQIANSFLVVLATDRAASLPLKPKKILWLWRCWRQQTASRTGYSSKTCQPSATRIWACRILSSNTIHLIAQVQSRLKTSFLSQSDVTCSGLDECDRMQICSRTDREDANQTGLSTTVHIIERGMN